MKKITLIAIALFALAVKPAFAQDQNVSDSTEFEKIPIAERKLVFYISGLWNYHEGWGGTAGFNFKNIKRALPAFKNVYVGFKSTYWANLGAEVGLNILMAKNKSGTFRYSHRVGLMYQWENNFLVSDKYLVSESLEGPKLMGVLLQIGPQIEIGSRVGLYITYYHGMTWDPAFTGDQDKNVRWRMGIETGLFINYGGKKHPAPEPDE